MGRAPIPKPTGPGATDPRTVPVRTAPRGNWPEILGPRVTIQSQRSAPRDKLISSEKNYHGLVGHYFLLPPGQMDVKIDFQTPVQNRAPWTAAPQ